MTKAMPETTTATLTMDGDSQIVRLPEEFRLAGTEVRVRRHGESLVLEPIKPPMSREAIEAIFAKLRTYHDIPFMPEGREQPPMPDDDIDLDRRSASIRRLLSGCSTRGQHR